MSDIVFPFTLTAGQPENVNQLNANLAAIKTVVDSEIGTTNLEAGAVTFAKLAAAVQALLVPTGTILATGAAAAPTGYLLCDGSSVLRATWPALFTAIGTAYGSADGTHFNVPDLKGRAPIGAGTGSGLSAKTLGTKVGTEPSNMPAHTHVFTLFQMDSSVNVGAGPPVATTTATTTASTQSAGSGSATDGNVPPSTVVNWIIKT